MTTAYTSLLGLALPVTGELSGTWGDTVNDYITQYLDSSVAGTQTISGSQTAVTLSKTTNASLSQVGSGATGSAQYNIINCTGNPASMLTVTVPAASKTYVVVNATSTNQQVKIVGAGPTTGVTLDAGEKAVIAWNGSDFIKIATSAVDGVSTFSAGTTGFTPSTATSGAVTLAGTLATTNGGTGLTSFTANQVFYASSTSAIGQSANLTFDGTTLTANALTTTSTVTLNGGTANGVAYLNGSKVLTTGSALSFDGGTLSANAACVIQVLRADNARGGSFYADNTGTHLTALASGNDPLLLEALGAGDIRFRINNSEQMRLTSTGLGIGTSSPTNKLSVSGNANITGNTTLGDATTDTVTVNGKIGVNTTDTSSGVLQIRQLADTNTGGIRLENTTNAGALVIYKQLSGGSIIRDSGSDSLLINGSAVTAYGNVTLGDASTDTVQVNGYMGVGGAADSSRGLNVVSSALTGTSQIGVLSQITATSSATSTVRGFTSNPVIPDVAFTVADVQHYRVNSVQKGASAVVTNQVGLVINDLISATNNYGITSLVSSGANKWNIYASGTAANYFAGDVLVGTTTSRTFGNTGYLSAAQIEGVTGSKSSLGITRNSANVSGSAITLAKSRGTTVGSNTVVVSGDELALVDFQGADGSGLISAARIQAFVDGTPGTNDMPGRLVFSTTADGASSPTERLRIDSSGNLGLGVTPSAWGATYKAFEMTYGSLYGGSTSFGLSGNSYFNGTNSIYKTTAAASQYSQAGGQHIWFTAPSGTAGNTISFTQAMTLSASGGLSVGTTSDAGTGNILLNANGKLCGNAPSGGTSSTIELYNSSTGNMSLTAAFSGAAITFATGGTTERARITSGGNLAIGQTSSALQSGGTGITLYGSSNSEIKFLNSSTGSTATDGTALVTSSLDFVINNREAGAITFGTSSTERARITSGGDVVVTGVGGLGYGTGSGGAVTQATSRTTGVTLDKTNGAITLVSAAGTTTWQTFTVTNNKVAATDTVIVNQKSGTDLYQIFVTNVAAGSFKISFATTGGTTTEQPVFNFAVIKAVTA